MKLLVLAAALIGGLVVGYAVVRADLLGPCPGWADERFRPATSAELRRALLAADPGDIIELRPAVYEGRFDLATDGAPRQRIELCGPPGSVIDAGDLETGYGLHITGDHWTVRGIELRNALKGIVLDDADHTILAGVFVHDIGTEGIRLRDDTTNALLHAVRVEDTGRTNAENGEAVYIGTASSQWCRRSECEPDRSDGNVVRDSVLGPGVTAEAIDVKEGTTAGRIRGNTFLGADLRGADSWLDIKGNAYEIVGNRGTGSPNDGVQVHVAAEGWGEDNQLRGNVLDVQGPGHGIWVEEEAQETTHIACSNVVRDAAAGFANVTCR